MPKEMKKTSVKKNEDEFVENTTTVNVSNISAEVKTKEQEEIEQLKKQLDMLQALLVSNSKPAVTSQNEDGYIRSDRSIQIMSLTPNLLNLSTQGNGRGKVFRFQKFGDVKNVIYSDLSDVLINYYKLAENGAFYIFDKEVVKRHGLESAYENILDKKGIDSFLEKDSSEIKLIFTKLSRNQQSAIVSAIVKKIVDDEDVSTSKVNLIKELYGDDIFAMADDMKNWESSVEELSK